MKPGLILWLAVLLACSGCATGQSSGVILHHQKKAGLTGAALDYYRQGDEFHKAGDYAKAIEAFQKAFQLQPDHPGAHNYLGYAYLNAGRLQEAKLSLDEAIRLAPRFACPHFGLFRYYMATGNKEAAWEEFKIFARLDPKSAKEILEQAEARKRPNQELLKD